MGEDYEVKLDEIPIMRDPNGRIIVHPLAGPYRHEKDALLTYGLLSFAGHDLDKSLLLDDVRLVFLEFFGEPNFASDREAWADPLRAQALERLTGAGRSWYIGVLPKALDGRDPGNPVPFEQERNEWRALSGGRQPPSTVVQSEIQSGYRKAFLPRLFFEVSNDSLANVITHYWPEAIPGYPVEGYNMSAGQIELLRKWDERPRDDRLFRDVVDQVFVSFYTVPSEHRHFAFVTNKLGLEQLGRLIDIQSLKQQAKEIGMRAG